MQKISTTFEKRKHKNEPNYVMGPSMDGSAKKNQWYDGELHIRFRMMMKGFFLLKVDLAERITTFTLLVRFIQL